MSSVVPESDELKRQNIVAFVIEELSLGGAEHMLMFMANEFCERGWQVHIICLRSAGELSSRLDESVQLHVLDKKPGIDLGLPLRLIRCVDKIQPDVINSHLWVANAWTRLSLLTRKIPIVVTEHSRDTWKSSFYRWVDRRLAARTFRLVTVSADSAEFYQNDVGIDQSLISVITNGVDTNQYAIGNGAALRREWMSLSERDEGESRVPMLIGTIGRLVKAKNQKRLIDAVSRLINDESLSKRFDIYLKIIGEGSERSALQLYIEELGMDDKITLGGERHDVPDVLAAFDVFVLSSDREGYPLTSLEAQAAGTPVILTDAGGAGESIACQGEQVGGLLVSPDTHELSKAIETLVQDENLRAQLGAFAQPYALEHFDKRRMIDLYEEVFLKSRLSG